MFFIVIFLRTHQKPSHNLDWPLSLNYQFKLSINRQKTYFSEQIYAKLQHIRSADKTLYEKSSTVISFLNYIPKFNAQEALALH